MTTFNIRYNTTTGQIISAGFCDFTPELQSGEAQADSGSDVIPPDITTAWTYSNGALVNTPPPAPPPTIDQQLAAISSALTADNASAFYGLAVAVYGNTVNMGSTLNAQYISMGQAIANILGAPYVWPPG